MSFVAAGLLGVVVITAALLALSPASHTVPALLFLVPIAGTSAFAGWRASMVVVLAASVAYAIAFVPPVGGLQIALTEDALALVTFLVVAVAVGRLKAPDRTPEDRPSEQLLDDRRAVLLRPNRR